MQNQPLISVILATHNREKYLKRAIESVLRQTYKNIELIVVNDGSTDQTTEILREYTSKDEHVKILTNKESIGFTKSLKRGIEEVSSGEYIARIDDDDFWCDDKKLEKQVQFLQDNQDYVLCGGGVIVVDEKEKEKIRFFQPEKDEDIRKSLLFLSGFVHSSVLFRKGAYLKVGGYDEQFNLSQDRDLWLKLGRVGKLYNFQEYFVVYLQSQGGLTHGKWQEQMKINAILRRKYQKDYPNYYLSILFNWFYYFYKSSFLRKLFYPISPKLRNLVFNMVNIPSDIYPPEKEKANKATLWEHYFARKIAFLILPVFLKLRISANQISIFSLLAAIIGAGLIAVGDFRLIISGGIMMQVWLVLDKTDGLLARQRKSQSKFGEFFEELSGSLVAVLFFSSIGVAASKFPGFSPSFFQLPAYFFIIAGALTSFFIVFRHLILRHFEVVFLNDKDIKTENLLSSGKAAFFYKIALKFLGVYSLAQPIFILAVIFNFLGLYVLTYFALQGLAMLASITSLLYKATKI